MSNDDLILQSALVGKPKYLQAIGLLNVEIAMLERSLGEMLSAILGTHWLIADAIFFASNSSIARMDIISRVAHLVLVSLPDEKKKVDAFLKRAKAVMGKRHDIVHGYWTLAPTGRHLHRIKLGALVGPTAVKLSELKAIAHDIQKLYSEIIRFNSQFQAEHPKDVPTMRDYWKKPHRKAKRRA